MNRLSSHRIIALGQAYVRIIESTDVLLERKPVWTERLLLTLVRSLCSHGLRGLVPELPGDVTDEILKASELNKLFGAGVFQHVNLYGRVYAAY